MIQPGDMDVDLLAYLEDMKDYSHPSWGANRGPAAARRALAAEAVAEAVKELWARCECTECIPRDNDNVETWPCVGNCFAETLKQLLAAYEKAKKELR